MCFNDNGECTQLTVGYVMDKQLGNTGGLGGVYGILYAIGYGTFILIFVWTNILTACFIYSYRIAVSRSAALGKELSVLRVHDVQRSHAGAAEVRQGPIRRGLILPIYSIYSGEPVGHSRCNITVNKHKTLLSSVSASAT